jgi:AcrR family transcriptional regulator
MGTMQDRMAEAGMTLFGGRGYDNTSVADIQVACGLTAGSGALYKHFPSKQALLAEGVHRYVASLEKSRAGLMEVLPDDPRQALEMIADVVAAAMARDVPAIRVLLRDLERFPDLLAETWDGLLNAHYIEFADWMRVQRDRGRITVTDPAATAAVLIASLAYHGVLEALIARAPGDVGLAAFLAAWVDSAAATLHLSPGDNP